MNFQQVKEHILQRLSKELAPTLYYHGIHHTLDVLNAANTLAADEGVKDEELTLLRTAALFHDAGFIEQYQHNEPIGAKIASETLPQFGYTPQQIAIITAIIMATARQQPPQTMLEKIMCDADLDYLGRNDYNTIADTLRKELNEQGVRYTDLQWLQMQLAFLEKHQYYTSAAIKKNNTNKLKHLNTLKQKLSTERL